MTTFLRLLSDKDKASVLLNLCTAIRAGDAPRNTFQTLPDTFRLMPGAPFSYWISNSIMKIFRSFPPFESGKRIAQHGGSTKDDFRFVRLWWEHSSETDKWTLFAKGGSFSPYYSDVYLSVNWKDDAKELEAALLKKYPYLGETANWVLHRECSYFLPGITWPRRAHLKASFRVLPRNCIFSDSGPCVFDEDLYSLLGILNSSAYLYLLMLLMPRGTEGGQTLKLEIGYVTSVPIPNLTDDQKKVMSWHASRSWQVMRQLDTVNELSHAFILPVELLSRLTGYNVDDYNLELLNNQEKIDQVAFDVYGFSAEDRTLVLGKNGQDWHVQQDGGVTDEDPEDENSDLNISNSQGLISWCVGVAFNRFDWRLATGERKIPPEPDPLDPLPAKSTGMLPDDAEPFYAHSGILVDDQGHPNDLSRLIEEVLVRVRTDVPGDVRRWLQRDFFTLHLKQYSKSRRKAPIYWPLSTNRGSYTLWVYYPSLTSETLYSAVNDFVEPKLKQVARDVGTLREKGSGRSRDDEKAFEALQSLELELIELRDTLLQIAPTYRPNHDDGVQITAAPLWQLFQHKPWQKVLKDTWAKLEKGDYDWAHLAMAYWPDRVCEKCKNDKSIAIAHDLEELYKPSLSVATGKRKKKGGST